MESFDTRAIHIGQSPDPIHGAVIPPIVLSSTHHQEKVGQLPNGYEYNRGGNPTRDLLQSALANLESGKFGFSFASGLAAEDAIIRAVLRPGDHVVLANDLYGGTYRLFNRVYKEFGIEFDVADLNDLGSLAKVVKKGKTKIIWIETPSNPYLTIFDIRKISDFARSNHILTVVDNTFATPYFQRPLELGADIVVHSTTKYIGGHSDILGGAIVLNDEKIAKDIHFIQFATGGVSSPFDAWLTHRSLKTLPIRMRTHATNAEYIAVFLKGRKSIKNVFYPGLHDHKGYELAKVQMTGFGGIISIEFFDERSAIAFCNSLKLFTLAESLGGVESLVNHPAQMTHASVRGTPLEVPPTIVRLSVGIEGVQDLIADLEQALDKLIS
jgi:cystathionine gamma-synthase